MSGLNKFTGIGNLTKDPEMKSTTGGKQIATLSVAINEGWGENKKITFLNLVAWEKMAEIVGKVCRKGSKIYFEGRLNNRTWDKPDGSKGYATDIVVGSILSQTPKNSDSYQTEAPAQPRL